MDQVQQGGGQAVLLTLFDNLWFQLSVLTTTTTTTTHLEGEQEEEEPPSGNSPPPVASSNITTEEPKAEENGGHHHQYHQRQSPERKLYTIISGKEALWGEESHDGGGELAATIIPKPSDRKQREKNKKKSKSMSELEFEELKGFMDLGFSFSEEEAADPRLVSIVPGLQRLRNEPGTVDDTADASVFRPYLSEAWEYRERVHLENALRRWRLPAPGRDVDLKKQLRCWAHTVASAVR